MCRFLCLSVCFKVVVKVWVRVSLSVLCVWVYWRIDMCVGVWVCMCVRV